MSIKITEIETYDVRFPTEITAAWDLIENTVREAMAERSLTAAAGRTPIRVTSTQKSPRLREQLR